MFKQLRACRHFSRRAAASKLRVSYSGLVLRIKDIKQNTGLTADLGVGSTLGPLERPWLDTQ